LLGLHCAEDKLSNNNYSLNDHKESLQILRDSRDSCYSAVLTLNDMVTSDKIRSGQLVLNKKYVNVINLVTVQVRDFHFKVSERIKHHS